MQTQVGGVRWHLAGLFFCLLVALALRLPGLTTSGLWVDEIATAVFAALPWAELFGPIARLETNPPYYYGAIKAWTTVAGGSDLALRLPSVLAGLGAIAATWLLAARGFGHRAAFWAALMLAITAWHVFQSREARAYAFVGLFYALGLLAARALAGSGREEMGRRAAMATALAACGTGAAYAHYSGILVAASAHLYGLSLLLARRQFGLRGLLWFVASGVACLALSVPVLALAVELATTPGNAVWWMQLERGTRIGYGLYDQLPSAPIGMVSPLPFKLLVAIGGGAFAVAMAWIHLRFTRNRAELLGLGGAVLATVAMFLGVEAITPAILSRALTFLLVPMVVLMGAAVAALPRPAARGLVFGAFAALQLPSLAQILDPPWGREWAGLARALVAPGPPVIATNIFEVHALDRYAPGAVAPDALLVPSDLAGLQRRLALVRGGPEAVEAPELAPGICALMPPPPQVRFFYLGSELGRMRMTEAHAALAAAGATREDGVPVLSFVLETWRAPHCSDAPQPR